MAANPAGAGMVILQANLFRGTGKCKCECDCKYRVGFGCGCGCGCERYYL